MAGYADLVVALDDGSTDGTREVLEAHPLVHTVLTNPRRDGYVGWDDAANRSRLLEVAMGLSASWAMSLDADELIPPDDAVALRSFLSKEADPEEAYLFRVFRMIGDLDHHDGSDLWVGRLFAPKPSHRFPSDRLHFVPLPTAIPSDRWRKTTVRIQHRGSLTADDRRARFAKYREVDPDRRWQSSYDHLLAAPSRPRSWWSRGRLLPTVVNAPVVDQDAARRDEPVVSVVVLVPPRVVPASDAISSEVASFDAASSDRAMAAVRRTVESVLSQEVEESFEVALVTSAASAAAARAEWPQLSVVVHGAAADGGAGPGSIRNQAMTATVGRHVMFVESADVLDPGCLGAVAESHRAGWPMVGFVPRHVGRSRSSWAGYLIEWSGALPGRGAFDFEVAPRRCSFHRELLEEIGGFPEDLPAGVEAAAAAELFDRGYGAHRPAGAIVEVEAGGGLVPLVRACFTGGRAEGRSLAAAVEAGVVDRGRAARRVARSLPGVLRRIDRDLRRWGGELRRSHPGARPTILVGAVAWWTGQWIELADRLRPRATAGAWCRCLRRSR